MNIRKNYFKKAKPPFLVLWYTTHMDKIRKVAVVLDSSHQISREMILGIIDWSRHHAHWDLSIVSGGPNDLRLP